MAATKGTVSTFVLVIILFCGASLGKSRLTKAVRLTLEEYVNRPDPAYIYREVKRTEDLHNSVFYLNMTSQKWMDEDFSDRSVWWHDMVVSVPHKLTVTDVALVIIGFGENDHDSFLKSEYALMSTVIQIMSVEMGIVVCYVRQIPNQPIVFKADPTKGSRREDDLISYLWRAFIDDEDASPEILIQYPMTKAVVRAMDTVITFTRDVAPNTNISKFVVTGISKRGWTAWTTAAVDKRVIGQMPVVMTLLNFFQHMQKHQRSLGGWSFIMKQYYDKNITRCVGNLRLEKAMELVNPYSFLDNYTMPTMVVDGTRDQFFLPDASHLFFSRLPGPKYMLMMPNRDHALAPFAHLLHTIKAFTFGVATGFHFPEISWRLIETETSGQIVFNSSDVIPKHVSSWHAITTSQLRRDFRANYGVNAAVSYVFWFEKTVIDKGDGIYVAEYDKPNNGWLGFLVKAEYDGPLGQPLTLTSEVNIVPNTFPYPPCQGDGCYGTLV
ncbi:hypothetical protein LSAT2_027836 [Lamellibrachia satsuma]|nr:hypothetical protein LSAT2_027836 [Lamellibrachia satsuma]